ncbi:MAG: hypothetical protein [Asgard archaea virus SkuldV2]|nr:MAG: hypothetical protein [Asgard archaea virus SkuldV2]
MLKIPENNNKIDVKINNNKIDDKIVQEVQEQLRFLSVLATTTTVSSGVRTESSEIDVPAELEGKKFKITDIWISAISSTGDELKLGDNLLVGLIIGGKPLLFGSKQTFNGITTSLDMLPVSLTEYYATSKVAIRKGYYTLLSELFNNIKKLKIVYSHKSENTVHYLLYVTIGGVIL